MIITIINKAADNYSACLYSTTCCTDIIMYIKYKLVNYLEQVVSILIILYTFFVLYKWKIVLTAGKAAFKAHSSFAAGIKKSGW